MKTKIVTAATSVLVYLLMNLLQGCVPALSLFDSQASSSSSVVYHFNPSQYFNNKEYKNEMPFSIRRSNVWSPLLNTREEFDKPQNKNLVYLSGALDFGG